MTGRLRGVAIEHTDRQSLGHYLGTWHAELALPIHHGSLTLQKSPVQESLFIEESPPV